MQNRKVWPTPAPFEDTLCGVFMKLGLTTAFMKCIQADI